MSLYNMRKYLLIIVGSFVLALTFLYYDMFHFFPRDQHIENVVQPEIPSTEKAIVAAARATENVSWMARVQNDWIPYPYNVDVQDANTTLKIPKNKGHEAMVYLSFIIERWTSLPKYTVFVHGHEKAWHQENDIVPLIQSLRLEALDAEGYVPLRCDWYPSCPREIRPVTHDAIVWGPGVHREDAEYGIVDAWPIFFPGVELPKTISSQCCAQFAVTNERIKSRSLETYVTMREWLLSTTLIDDVSGRVLEKLWAYIFTNETVHCPLAQHCACDFFGMCQPKNWGRPPLSILQAESREGRDWKNKF